MRRRKREGKSIKSSIPIQPFFLAVKRGEGGGGAVSILFFIRRKKKKEKKRGGRAIDSRIFSSGPELGKKRGEGEARRPWKLRRSKRKRRGGRERKRRQITVVSTTRSGTWLWERKRENGGGERKSRANEPGEKGRKKMDPVSLVCQRVKKKGRP